MMRCLAPWQKPFHPKFYLDASTLMGATSVPLINVVLIRPLVC